MGMASGVVGYISIKEVAPDNYDNRFLCSFKMEDDENWYGCGKQKYERIGVKVGKEYQNLEKGDTISFFYEESEYNGKTYFNVKPSGIRLESKGAGQPRTANAAPAQRAAPQRSAGQSSAAPVSRGAFTGNELSIKAGRAVNAAVSLFVAGKVRSMQEGLYEAIALEKFADAEYNTLYAEVEMPRNKVTEELPKEQVAPPAQAEARAPRQAGRKKQERALEQQHEQAQADDDFDDDIPFDQGY